LRESRNVALALASERNQARREAQDAKRPPQHAPGQPASRTNIISSSQVPRGNRGLELKQMMSVKNHREKVYTTKPDLNQRTSAEPVLTRQAPGFNSEIVSKKGSGQGAECGHQKTASKWGFTPRKQKVRSESVRTIANATIFKSIIHEHETIAMRSHAMYTLFMSLGPTNQKMAQVCCLCCAYVSSGTGRLVN